MNLFEKLQLNKITPLLERKKGHFVVDENNGIALLVASNYKKNKGYYHKGDPCSYSGKLQIL